MESPSRALTLCPSPPPLHSRNPSRRRRSSSDSAASPEFEFWNIGRNPEPAFAALHSADELFSDGVLLPLHLISYPRDEPEELEFEPGSYTEPDRVREPEPEPGPSMVSSETSALITSEVSSNANPLLSASKRWKEIFKRGNNNSNNSNTSNNNNSKSNNLEEIKVDKLEKKKGKKEKKTSSGNNNSGIGNNSNSVATELNINIWPFSRSRSAGNNSNRSNKPAASNRKVSSAPCSRSNSSGESKSSRKSWPSSPGRAGVHLGRASPVWQAKRGSAGPGTRAGGGGNKGRVLKLNVPVCIGYRQHMSCRSDENGAVIGGGGSGGGELKTGGGNSHGGNGNLFGFRGLFSKKSSATVLTV